MNKYEIRITDDPHLHRKYVVDAVDLEDAEAEAIEKLRELCDELGMPFSDGYIGELVADRNGVTIRELPMDEQMTRLGAPMLALDFGG